METMEMEEEEKEEFEARMDLMVVISWIVRARV